MIDSTDLEDTTMPHTRQIRRPQGMPPALARLTEDMIVDVDVREDLRNGEEPFRKIMAAREQVPEGGALRLRAIFEPVPLYRVLGGQGLSHWTEQLAEDDWRVWFYPDPESFADSQAPAPDAGTSDPAAAPPRSNSPSEVSGDDVVILDVRGMEPPQPLIATLEALEELPPNGTLLQINVRVPRFLLPQLKERGWRWDIREQEDGPVRVFIRRAER